MHTIEIILGLLVAVVILISVARRFNIAYPILLVVGGLVLSFIPGLPEVELEPELVFILFLPPLLQAGAFFTSLRDLRANLRPITLLAVGLPLFTIAFVAVVAHIAIPGLTWAAAFALGAIVAPPDAVAVMAVASQLHLPRRIVTLLEGESLLNDATALVAYRLAVGAAVTGVFSIWDASLRFMTTGVGGIVVGIIIGLCSIWVFRRLQDPPIAISLSLLMPFAAYLPAEALGLSGVLAVVTAGLFLGQNSSKVMSSQTRVQAGAVWEILVFLLNGIVFMLIGLQLRGVLSHLAEYSLLELIWYAALVSVAVIVARIVWVFPATYLPRFFSNRIRARDPYPPVRGVTIVAWAGMRGVVSLAAALAIPLTTDSGAPFPARELIIFMTFCVILATLVLQGLSLPPLIRALGLQDDGATEREEAEARLQAAQAAMDRIRELSSEEWVPKETIGHLHEHYEERLHVLNVRYHGVDEHEGHDHEEDDATYQKLKRDLLDTERRTIIRLRDQGVIHDEVLRIIERELDLEELQLKG
jgi:Na+/H+ antiporter